MAAKPDDGPNLAELTARANELSIEGVGKGQLRTKAQLTEAITATESAAAAPPADETETPTPPVEETSPPAPKEPEASPPAAGPTKTKGLVTAVVLYGTYQWHDVCGDPATPLFRADKGETIHVTSAEFERGSSFDPPALKKG